MADAHRSSSPDSLFVPQDSHYNNTQTSQRPRLESTLALPPRRPTHFAGDGYDFRRPVMSAGGGAEQTVNHESTAVIDLTEDVDPHERGHQAGPSHATATARPYPRAQRPPRFGRDIIDVESEEEEDSMDSTTVHQDPTTDHGHPQYSILRRPQRLPPSHTNMSSDNTDDLLFVEQRPRSRLQTASRAQTPATLVQRNVTPYPVGLSDTIDLTGEDDDVVHVESRIRPRANLERPTVTGGVGTRSIIDRIPMFGNYEIGNRLLHRLGFGIMGMRAQQAAFEDLTHERHLNTGTSNNRHQRDSSGPPPQLGIPPGSLGPVPRLDYGAVGFDMGGDRPPTPKYEPPEPANPGFTRSPEENEVVVCPNCGDELAIGDTDQKQEVWVIKKCGHAYCGDCAHKRAKSSRATKKGKGKTPVLPTDGPPTFKTCVVDGCKEPAAAKSMVHVYLSS